MSFSDVVRGGELEAKRRFPIAVALPVAEELKALLAPACDRIEIGGSLRRGRATVGDIELVYIPRPAANGFFTDALDELLRTELAGELAARLNVRGRVAGNGALNRLLVHVRSGIPVDLFSTEPRYWGMALFVRTGPAEWNIRAMDGFRQRGMQGHAYGGVTARNGSMMECPDEATVFRLLNWPFTEPRDRR